MGVFSYESEVASELPPAILFNAMVLDTDNLLINITPNRIQKSEIIEGDGGPRSIKRITFVEANHIIYMTMRTEEVDKENFVYNYSVLEGKMLGDKLEKITYETKLVPNLDGGSIFKTRSKYYTIGDHQINEDHFNVDNEKSLKFFKAIESYLIANPGAYN